ncbi:MAG TPA: hypothetical protein PKM43_24070, partial [Verrucomicrobiota bacterium]|nr:hypothetical protein [Verrucomicrobiota bacterium]
MVHLTAPEGIVFTDKAVLANVIAAFGEQGADAVEFDAGGGVEPAEAPDAMKAGGQDMLEDTADQLEGFEIDVLWAACGAVSIRPAHPAIREQGQVAVAG